MAFQDHDSSQLPLPDAQTPSTRLIISKMVLKNFKSYAGIQEVGPFHKVRFATLEFEPLFN
jgi:hypothetical protein